MTGLPRVRGVFFDLGDTLIDNSSFRRAAGRRHMEFLAANGVILSLRRVEILRKKAAKRVLSRLEGTTLKHQKYVFFEEFMRLSDPKGRISESVWKVYYDGYLARWQKNKKLLSGAKALLSFLRRKGIRLALISNGSVEGVEADLEKTGLAKYFDSVLVSEKLGREKSGLVPYRIALRLFGIRPGQVAMVGDNLFEDVHSARRAGIGTTIRLDRGSFRNFRKGEFKEADYVCKDLAGVRRVLGKLV